jgi:hypothetical protein
MPQAPTAPSQRLRWLVGEGAKASAWLPTPEEQDAAFDVVFGERLQMMKQASWNAQVSVFPGAA